MITLSWILLFATKSCLISAAGLIAYAMLSRRSASWRFLALSTTMLGLLFATAMMFAPPLIQFPILLGMSGEYRSESSVEVDDSNNSFEDSRYSRTLDAYQTSHPRSSVPENQDGRAALEETNGERDATSSDTTNSLNPFPNPDSQSVPAERTATHWMQWMTPNKIPLVLILIWGLGALLVLLKTLFGLFAIFCVNKKSQPVTDSTWQKLLDHLRGEFRLWRHIRLQVSRSIPSAMTWGLFRPTIVVPSFADQWSHQQKKIVLQHELAHIRRNDWIIQMMGSICLALHWMNPMAWSMCRRMQTEREKACDDLVLESGVDSTQYAEVLFQLAADTRPYQSFAALPMAQISILEQRMRSILDGKRRRDPTGRRVSTTMLITGMLLILPLSLSGAVVPGKAVEPAAGPSGKLSRMLASDKKEKTFELENSDSERIRILNGVDGTPIANAQVHYETNIDPNSGIWDFPLNDVARTDSRGEVELPRDTLDYLMFRVSHPRFLRGRFESTGISVPGHTLYKSAWPYGTAKGKKILKLWPGATIKGTLKQENGEPVRNYRFQLVSRSTDLGWYKSVVDSRTSQSLGPAMNRPPVEWRCTTRTDKSGNYVVAVPPKSFRKEVLAIGYSENLAPFEQVVEVGQANIAMEKGCIVQGVYRQRDGSPVANSYLSLHKLQMNGEQWSPETSRTTITDANGRFKFPPAASGPHLLDPHRGVLQRIVLQSGKEMDFDAEEALHHDLSFDLENSLNSFSGNLSCWIKGDIHPKGGGRPVQRAARSYLDGDRVVFQVPQSLKNAKLHFTGYPAHLVYVVDGNGTTLLPSVDTQPIEIPNLLDPPRLTIHLCKASSFQVKVLEADGKLARKIKVSCSATSEKGERNLGSMHPSGNAWVRQGLMEGEKVKVTVHRGDWTFTSDLSEPIDAGTARKENEMELRLPPMKVSTGRFREGTYFGYTGYMTYVIRLKEGRFQYWFESDSASRDKTVYPLTGKYSVADNTITLHHEKLISLSSIWQFRSVNGIPTLWRSDAVEQHRNKALKLSVEDLRAWGSGSILAWTSQPAELMWKNRTAPSR